MKERKELEYFSVEKDSRVLVHILPYHYDTREYELMKKIYDANLLYGKPGLKELLQEYVDKVIISQMKN